MTTIYVPRLIESVEQAEALPVGTIAWDRDPAMSDQYSIAEKGEPWSDEAQGVDDPPWWIGRGQDGATDAQMIGWTALVPIEAEEEWTVGQEDPSWAPGTESWARRFQAQEPGRRLFRRSVTPWEEA